MYVCVLYDSREGGKRRKKDFEVCLLRNDRPGRSIYSVWDRELLRDKDKLDQTGGLDVLE